MLTVVSLVRIPTLLLSPIDHSGELFESWPHGVFQACSMLAPSWNPATIRPTATIATPITTPNKKLGIH